MRWHFWRKWRNHISCQLWTKRCEWGEIFIETVQMSEWKPDAKYMNTFNGNICCYHMIDFLLTTFRCTSVIYFQKKHSDIQTKRAIWKTPREKRKEAKDIVRRGGGRRFNPDPQLFGQILQLTSKSGLGWGTWLCPSQLAFLHFYVYMHLWDRLLETF